MVEDAKGRLWQVYGLQLWYSEPPLFVWKKSTFWPDFLNWKDGELCLVEGSTRHTCSCSTARLMQSGCNCGGI